MPDKTPSSGLPKQATTPSVSFSRPSAHRPREPDDTVEHGTELLDVVQLDVLGG